jgi:predicted acylesterase/phospholipase RssA
MKRILTVDGGGIRGIIPARFCVELEDQLVNSSDGQPDIRRLSDVFDLIGGTSTGGLIALALAKPPEGQSQESVAQAILALYKQQGPTIFGRPRGLLGNLFWPKYDATPLEKILKDFFGETRLGQATTPVLVTYYDMGTRSVSWLTSWDHPDCLMREAARATSAAPTYFAPVFFPTSPDRPFVDGGMFANNPAGVAYLQAKTHFPDEDLLFVAVGTGTLVELPATRQGIDPKGFADWVARLLSAPGWGLAEWAAPLLPSVFDGMSDFADDLLTELLPQHRYFRMQIKIAAASEKLDNVSQSNLMQLDNYGVTMFKDHSQDLSILIPLLKTKSLPAPTSADAVLAVFSADRGHGDPEKVRLLEAALEPFPGKPEVLKLQNVKQLDDTNLSLWHGIFLPLPYQQGIEERLIDRLVTWVRKGGRLVITGYELGEHHHMTNINQLAYRFGLRFNGDVVVGPNSPDGPGERDYDRPFMYDRFPNREHPLLQGVQCIYARNACSLTLDPGSESLVSIAPNKIRDFNPQDAAYKDPDGDGVFELRSPVTRYGKAYEDPHRSLMAIAPAGLTGRGGVLGIGTWDFRPDERSPVDNDTRVFIRNVWNWLCAPG